MSLPAFPAFALRALAYAWAAPYSGLGLLFGVAALAAGARMRVREGTVEIGGGAFGRLAGRLPAPAAFCAITLGHVILALDGNTLDKVRAHEQVHVRQYERWGLFFVPAYLLSSLVELLRGRRPYLDNAFEREAYRAPGRALGAHRRPG